MDGKRKAAILFQTLMSKSKKRQKKEEEELEDLLSSLNEDVESEEEVDADMAAIGAVSFAAVTDSTSNRSSRPRAAAIDRNEQKEMWGFGYSSYLKHELESPERRSIICLEKLVLISWKPQQIWNHGQSRHTAS